MLIVSTPAPGNNFRFLSWLKRCYMTSAKMRFYIIIIIKVPLLQVSCASQGRRILNEMYDMKVKWARCKRTYWGWTGVGRLVYHPVHSPRLIFGGTVVEVSISSCLGLYFWILITSYFLFTSSNPFRLSSVIYIVLNWLQKKGRKVIS